jgi:4-amino-4-deoxy-L-arabinose transferase-like glycosyltransferase
MEPRLSTSATQDMHARARVWLRSRSIHALLVVTALTAVWFSLAEGRYAEIPREMLVSGNWVTPHLNDLAYLEKPPLQYWATGLAYQLFGANEWSARLWTVLSGWLDVLLVFLLARRLWDFRTGVIAAALLGSTLLHFFMGQVLTLDMAFTCLMTAMLCAFCMAQADRDSRPRGTAWMLVSWAALGLAILTKGIAAIVIVGAVLTLYVVWQRDWAVLRTLRPIPGILVLAAITLPWFVLVSRANPDFLKFFFLHEHFERYLTDEANRVEPWWYFIGILAAGVLPWLPQMSGALLSGWRTSAPKGQFSVQRLLWLWCVFVFAFFSLSGSKLAPYILPLFPPLALLAAVRLSSAAPRSTIRGLTGSLSLMVAFAAACVVYVLIVAPGSTDPILQSIVYEARAAVWTLAAVAVVTAFVCRRAATSGEPTYAIVSLAVGWCLVLAILFATVGHESGLRSGRDLAARIPPELATQAPIYSVQLYDQTLPFYLKRTLTLVEGRGGELDYGIDHEPYKEISDMATFERIWRAAPQAVAIMPHETYAQLAASGFPMRLLAKDRRKVAVSRR